MPLTLATSHTHTGKADGAVVASPEYNLVSGTSTEDLRYKVVAAPRGPVVDFSAITAASGTKYILDNAANDTKFGQLSFRVFFTAAPSTSLELVLIRTGTMASNSKQASVLVGVAGGLPTLRVRGGADATLTGWTTSTTLALNTWYTVQVRFEAGTTTSNGKTAARIIRDSDSVELAAGESTNLNSGTANVATFQMGKLSSSAAMPVYIDDVAWLDNAYAYIPVATDPPAIPEESASNALQTRVHTHLGRVPDTAIGADEYEVLGGSDTVRRYGEMPNGSVCADYDGPSGLNGFTGESLTSSRKASWAAYMTIKRAPDVNAEIHNFRASAPTAASTSSLVLNANLTLRLNTGTGGSSGLDVSPALNVGQTYLVQFAQDTGTNATNGRMRLRIRTLGGTTVLQTESTNLDLGQLLITSYRQGKIGTTPNAGVQMDGVKALAGVYLWADPAEDQPNAGPDLTVEPLSEITLVGQGPGAWTAPSGVTVSGSGSVITFDAPIGTAQQVFTFGYGTDSMTVTVLPATERIGAIPCIIRAGTPTGIGQGPGGGDASKVAYSPPTLTNPTTLTATDSNASFANLNTSQDYIIRLPGAPGHPQQTPLQIQGGLSVTGGRHIVIIGGEIRHSIDYVAGTNGTRGQHNRAMFFRDWTGDLFIEGVEFSGTHLFEGINFENDQPNARMFVQNLRCASPLLALGGTGGHEGGDLLQGWAGPLGGLFIDRVTATKLGAQGIFLQPYQFAWGQPYAPRITRISRVDMAHWTTAERDAYPMVDQGPNPQYTTYFDYAILVQAGKLEQPGSGTGKKYEFSEVYLAKNPAKPFTGAGLAHAVEPKSNSNAGVQLIGGTDENGRKYVEWVTTDQSDRRIFGRIFQGPPPAPFVPSGAAGIGYVSPGYLGMPTT